MVHDLTYLVKKKLNTINIKDSDYLRIDDVALDKLTLLIKELPKWVDILKPRKLEIDKHDNYNVDFKTLEDMCELGNEFIRNLDIPTEEANSNDDNLANFNVTIRLALMKYNKTICALKVINSELPNQNNINVN